MHDKLINHILFRIGDREFLLITIKTFYCSILQAVVDLEDFRNAQPDAIAHSSSKIISRLKAGGEKTTQALKSLCWRCKGIQVEVRHISVPMKFQSSFDNVAELSQANSYGFITEYIIFLCNLLQEATLIDVDTLGFDLRVCSGRQVQTLRFTFNTRVCQSSFGYKFFPFTF